MQKLKHNLAGHTSGPESLLHEGVLCFGHHAAGQGTIFVRTVASLMSVNIPGDRAFMSSASNAA